MLLHVKIKGIEGWKSGNLVGLKVHQQGKFIKRIWKGLKFIKHSRDLQRKKKIGKKKKKRVLTSNKRLAKYSCNNIYI